MLKLFVEWAWPLQPNIEPRDRTEAPTRAATALDMHDSKLEIAAAEAAHEAIATTDAGFPPDRSGHEGSVEPGEDGAGDAAGSQDLDDKQIEETSGSSIATAQSAEALSPKSAPSETDDGEQEQTSSVPVSLRSASNDGTPQCQIAGDNEVPRSLSLQESETEVNGAAITPSHWSSPRNVQDSEDGEIFGDDDQSPVSPVSPVNGSVAQPGHTGDSIHRFTLPGPGQLISMTCPYTTNWPKNKPRKRRPGLVIYVIDDVAFVLTSATFNGNGVTDIKNPCQRNRIAIFSARDTPLSDQNGIPLFCVRANNWNVLPKQSISLETIAVRITEDMEITNGSIDWAGEVILNELAMTDRLSKERENIWCMSGKQAHFDLIPMDRESKMQVRNAVRNTRNIVDPLRHRTLQIGSYRPTPRCSVVLTSAVDQDFTTPTSVPDFNDFFGRRGLGSYVHSDAASSSYSQGCTLGISSAASTAFVIERDAGDPNDVSDSASTFLDVEGFGTKRGIEEIEDEQDTDDSEADDHEGPDKKRVRTD